VFRGFWDFFMIFIGCSLLFFIRWFGFRGEQRFPLELQFRLFLMVDVGRPAAVNGVPDGGVFRQLILQIHHRLGAPDEQDGVAVVQPPHFIGGQQFSATLSSDELKNIAKKQATQINSCSLLRRYILLNYHR